MKFEQDLIKLLTDKKLSNSSIITYIKILRKLNNNKPLQNIVFLKDSKKIIEDIKHYKTTTQRNILITIVSALKVLQKTTDYKKYYDLMINKTKEINSLPKNEKTETQSKNWIEWADVLTIYNNLKSKLKFSKIVTEDQFTNLFNYFILSLYVLIPPRRNKDYLLMKITNNDTSNVNYNYLDLKKKQFIFNVFKTSKKDGQLIINIPEDLFTIIKLYIKYHPLKHLLKKENISLLVKYDGEPYKLENSITRILNKIFNKKIGASMLRHIYLSSKYKNIIKEQELDSKNMSHNLLTQKDYIKI